MRISDWSSDVCSSDLHEVFDLNGRPFRIDHPKIDHRADADGDIVARDHVLCGHVEHHRPQIHADHLLDIGDEKDRSEEHTSELQSLMRISYAVFCLKKKTKKPSQAHHTLYSHQTITQP